MGFSQENVLLIIMVSTGQGQQYLPRECSTRSQTQSRLEVQPGMSYLGCGGAARAE